MTQHLLSTLPPDLRYRLLVGATGKHHLADIARLALSLGGEGPASGPALASLAKELFTAAWLADPLDGTLAADLAEFERRLPTLAPKAVPCVKAAASLCRVPDPAARPPRLAALEGSGEYEPLARWLDRELAAAPQSGFLAWTLYHHALRNRDFERGLAVAARFAAMPGLGPLAAKLSADVRFLAGDFARAAEDYAATDEVFPGLCADRLGEALIRAGKREQGLAALARAVTDHPWMVNATLRLHDLATGRADERASLHGRTAILLYSYNNATQLDLTLRSLHESLAHGPDVLVRVLRNGPEGGTGEVVRAWRDRFGSLFGEVALPVNVGAPAARNWLASLPEVRQCAFAAYLDDDVRLPPDWLDRFGAAVAARPDASLWGCRVVDYERPGNLQQVDLHPMARDGEGDEPLLSEAHLGAFDFGQFAYLRPAGSVTGCCHLFRTGALLDGGGFDVRFTPSQYDDLDHDLRLCLAGKTIVYQGHLAVEHMKLSGRVAANPLAAAYAAGNLRKLRAKYSREDLRALRAHSLALLEQDFGDKLDALDSLPTP